MNCPTLIQWCSKEGGKSQKQSERKLETDQENRRDITCGDHLMKTHTFILEFIYFRFYVGFALDTRDFFNTLQHKLLITLSCWKDLNCSPSTFLSLLKLNTSC